MKHLTIISLLLSIATFSILASGQTVRPKTSQQSVGKQSQEVDEFIKRFGVQEHRNLLDGALWTLTHDYSEFKQMEEVLKTFQSYFEALSKYEQGDSSSIEKIGGIKAFKNKLAEWLKDDDQSIRAFAAVVLGISGDKSFAPQLAELLKERKIKENDIRYDRGRAAMALGLVGAKEYTSSLAKLLKSSDEYDRVGAAYGLGFLKARKQSKAVAILLNDEESVREAAKESLTMMKATNLVKEKKAEKPDK